MKGQTILVPGSWVCAKNNFIKSAHRVFHLCAWLPVIRCWEAEFSRATAAGEKAALSLLVGGSCSYQILWEWRICERGEGTHWWYCVPSIDITCAAGPQWQGTGYQWCTGLFSPPVTGLYYWPYQTMKK